MAVLLACSASFSREWSHRSAKWPSASATASVPVAICPSRRRLPMPRRSLVTAANWRDSTCSSPGSTSMRPISPPRPLFWCCIRHRVRMNRPIRFGRIPSRPQPRSCGERMAVREFPALGFDPAPGQPAELDSLGHDVARHATALAADGFAAEIAPLPGDLDRSAGAFGTVAGALDAYARELDGAQRRAMLLEQRAAQARAAQQRAAAQAAVLRHAPDGETDAIRRAREADLRAAHLRAADADGELGAIIREAHGLHEHAFGVAEQTARQIRAAAELAPYREPNLFQQGLDRLRQGWESTKQWVAQHADVLRTISGVLKGIAAAAATLALVVQFVPVVGQVAGTISLAVAAVAGGAALGIDVLLKLSTGEGSWASLGLDFTLTVIPGAALTRAGKALLRPAARALPALARTPLVAKVLRPVEATITAARRELPGVARIIRGRLDTARRLAASERGSIGGGGEELAEQLRRQKLAALGEEIQVPKPDPVADALAQRIGGRPRIKFSDDPDPREFDAVSDDYIGQTKPGGLTIGSAFRKQAKATFEAAITTGRRPYFHFNGPPSADVLEALERYKQRYK